LKINPFEGEGKNKSSFPFPPNNITFQKTFMTILSFIKQNIKDIKDTLPVIDKSLESTTKIGLQLQYHANRISHIPLSFFTASICSSLIHLDLSSNALKSLDWLDSAPVLPRLVVLNLSNNLLQKVSGSALLHCPTLKKLNLSHNNISDLSGFGEVSNFMLLEIV
jgi:Leucine-rich repeat (LRR) protein